MANRFANAGQSADRRRRRLSHDVSDDDLFAIHAESAASKTGLKGNVWKSEFDTQFLRKFVSPDLWKHMLAITVLVLLAAVAICQIGSGEAAGLRHTASRIASCLLLLAGQLALLIGWIRAESDVDYKGRYRWWTSLSIALLLAAVLRLTDLTGWAADTLIATAELATGSLNAARVAILFVPFSVGTALLAYRIIPDMQRCFESQLAMVLTTAAVLTHTAWTALALADTSGAIVASLDLSVAVLFFSSLLLHARYVAYVNHDPPVPIQNSVTEAVPEAVPENTLDLTTHTERASEAASDVPDHSAQDSKLIPVADQTSPNEVDESCVSPAPKKARTKKRQKSRRAA